MAWTASWTVATFDANAERFIVTMALVVMTDFTDNSRTTAVLNAGHFAAIARVWEREDDLFVEMQHHDLFAGRRRWCDLTPLHYRLMIAHNLTIAASLGTEERADSQHPVVRSLHLLVTALVFCLQSRSECLVEVLRIFRRSGHEVTYDFTASLGVEADAQPPKGGLRLVVDNEQP